MSVTTRQPLAGGVLDYAEEKLRRLGRHAHIDDLTMVIDHDPHSTRASSAEVVAHMHHVRLVARGEGVTVIEAIDLALDRADRQVLRRKGRATERKGHVGANGQAPGHGSGAPTAAR